MLVIKSKGSVNLSAVFSICFGKVVYSQQGIIYHPIGNVNTKYVLSVDISIAIASKISCTVGKHFILVFSA